MTLELFLKHASEHLTPDNLLLVGITWGVLKIYNRAKNVGQKIKTLEEACRDCASSKERLSRIERLVKKMRMVMEQCPSVSKLTIGWLSDNRQNSNPPQASCCKDVIDKFKRGK